MTTQSRQPTPIAPGTPVGLIGLGLLGQGLAKRLLAAGFKVIGYDVDAAKGAALASAGGAAVDSIAAVAARSSTIVLAVFDTAQVEDVVEAHLVPAWGAKADAVVLCVSTCDPDRIAAIAARVAPRGVRFLETPVSGSSAQVAAGDGVALVGGDLDAISAMAPQISVIVSTMFPVHFHVGKIGDGGRAKLAINLILGLNRMALAEGLVFAERVGLDPAKFLAMAKKTAAYAQVMDIKGDKMVGGDFTPQGFARQHLKDIELMRDQLRNVGQILPMLQVHFDVLSANVAHGEGDLDNSVVIQELRRRRGQP